MISSPHDISQSISECYLNQRSRDTNKDDYSKSVPHIEIMDNSMNDTFGDAIQVGSAHDYGSCLPRDISVQLVNNSLITSITESPFVPRHRPTNKSASFVKSIILTIAARGAQHE